ncbi:MAG TPA: metallophosphoesterase family protein [Steroidobacteraceae bacterium]|jgi:calcineurin-like phosphoesterase family protein|nr:metallophosphoesterase family protein [Steroidobacteraceae bacterium]
MTARPFDFFYSDPHFGHDGVVALAGRPFADVAEMDQELERRYCAAVKPGDDVLFCGDVSFADDAVTTALLLRLPGRKVLVRGNHDGTITHCLRMGFAFVADVLHLQIAGHRVTVCHYPPANATSDVRYPDRRPPAPAQGAFVLHGHTHEKARRIGRRIHVGVDAWDYAPVPYAAVEALVREP